jgi:hypothetical protein
MIGAGRSSIRAGELVMKIISSVCVTVLMLGSAYARAQSAEDQPYEESDVQAQAAQAAPPSAAPTDVPPAPPQQLPPPPQAQVPQQQYQYAQPVQAAPPVAQAPATGQWVYTSQYGWVWMPYGTQYTYTPTDTGVYPSEYVYYPTYGWTWVTAPWVFGWGVQPFFGVYGPWHYGWYHHAVAYGGWRGYGYGHVYGAGYRGYGGGWRPGYAGYRGGYAAPHYAAPRSFGYGAGTHVYRGAPAFGGHVGGGGFHGGNGGGFHGGFGGGHSGGGFRGGFGGGHFGGGHGGRH